MMHKANWSTSHIYYSQCLTLVLTSPSKPDITIHTVHLVKKWEEEYSAVCIISSFVVMANFMCQPDSAMGCQNSWSYTIPGCVHEGIFYKITI